MPVHPQVEALLAALDSYGDPPIDTSPHQAVRAVGRGPGSGAGGPDVLPAARSPVIPTTLLRYDGMFHAFFAFADTLDDCREAVRRTGAALRAHVDAVLAR